MRREKTVLLLVVLLATSFALTMNLKPVAAYTLPTWTSASDAKVQYDWPTGPSTSWSYAIANPSTMEERLMAQNDWGYANLYYYFRTYGTYNEVDLKVFASELSYDLQYAGPVPGSGNAHISFEALIYPGADKDHLGSQIWYTQFRYDVCYFGDLPVYISSMLWDKSNPLSGSMPAGQYVLLIRLTGSGVSGIYGTAVIQDYQDFHNGDAYVKMNWVQLTLTYTPKGGCPNLLVWDGSSFVDEGVLNIHNLVNPESDVVVQHTLTTTPTLTDHGRCALKLAEIGAGYDYSHSWINHVKLYAVDDEGVRHLWPLVFANSSRDGNVFSLLLRSDDNWAQTFKGDEITLQFIAPRIEDAVQFIFVIVGHNIKT